jgi:hypothetical protein
MNIELILTELCSYSSDYLKLLNKEDQIKFLSEWNDLATNMASIPARSQSAAVLDIINNYPELSKEFSAAGFVPRFDPYKVPEKKDSFPRPPVIIANEVIRIQNILKDVK